MKLSSDLAEYYRILELPPDATVPEIKLAYRQLARRYHPDVNPGDRQAEARFKQIALAYKSLIEAIQQMPSAQTQPAMSNDKPLRVYANPAKSNSSSTSPRKTASARVRFYIRHPYRSAAPPADLSPQDRWLKLRTLKQVYSLMKRRKWQQAIDLLERLAKRFPGDLDVCQWQAVAYHCWARKLIDRKQYDQARTYLKKALQTNPHDRKLWDKIEQDYKRMERQLKL